MVSVMQYVILQRLQSQKVIFVFLCSVNIVRASYVLASQVGHAMVALYASTGVSLYANTDEFEYNNMLACILCS